MSLLTDLIAAWELNEASGNAVDSHGSNTLTETSGTIGAAAGPGGAGGSRDFESADTEWFAIADNTALSMGDIDFTIEIWANLESIPGEMDLISKYETVGNSREYRIRYEPIAQRLQLAVSPDGSGSFTGVNANNLGLPSTGTWYQIIAWHDSINNQLGIAINDGTPDTASHSTGVFNGTSPLHIGALGRASVTFYYDGLLSKTRIWKRMLTSGERTQLYNSGSGLAYTSFSSGSIDETMSGGIYGSGLASTTTNYNHTSTEGCFGAGSATLFAQYNHTSTEGCFGAGSATLFAQYNHTSTEGCFGAGSGVINCNYNHTPTQGCFGAGSATLFAQYNHTSTEGCFGAGSATLFAQYNHTSTQGCFGAGSAALFAQYNHTSTEGCFGAGSGAINCNYSHSHTSTQGCWAAGSGSLYEIDNFPVFPAGVICSGLALCHVVTMAVGTGGALCDGTVVLSSQYNPLVVANGVLCQGVATLTVFYNSEASSGVICGGTATVEHIDGGVSSGGVYCGGSAICTENAIGDVSGGSYAAGTVFVSFQYNPLIIANGVVCGGASDVTHSYNPQANPSGAIINGIATFSALYNPEISGFGLGGGTAQVEYIENDTAEGVYCGGRADVGPDPAAGVQCSGAAVVSYIKVVLTSGTVTVGGSAAVSNDYINLAKLTYHRFNVGERVYALCAVQNRYLRQRVQSVWRFGPYVYYEFPNQRVTPEQYVISNEEQLSRTGNLGAYKRKGFERNRSWLKEVPQNLVPLCQDWRR